ncbi:MAG: hypothetical protein P8171_10580 [Candidatus Thiodiazotropha sp.]
MKSLKYLIKLALLIYTSKAFAIYEDIHLPSETPTNAAPFVITLSGCQGSSPPVFFFYGMEVEEGVINLYAADEMEVGLSVPSCYVNDVEIGPIASGSYTINYYTGVASQTVYDLSLDATETIDIVKASDQEPPLGHVTISGETVEDQLLTATHNLSDRNGMGDITFQWFRNDQPIFGANNEAYFLKDEDVGQSISVTASYVDGLGHAEHVSSLPLALSGKVVANVNDVPIGSVFIRGSLSEGSTLTIDTDSLYDADGVGALSYEWQHRYRTDHVVGPVVGSDSATYQLTSDDLDYMITAIVSYTDDYGTQESIQTNLTGRVVPSTYPMVIPPEDLTIAATGFQTLVEPGMATAHDNQGDELDTSLTNLVSNGVNTPLQSNGLLYLQPGTHLLTWSATDGNDLTGEAIQIVRVEPNVEFYKDRSSTLEGPFDCPLEMNGPAPNYPVSVTYTLYGVLMADQSKTTLHEGDIQFSGDEQLATLRIPNAVVGDVADYESLLLVMDQVSNATMGEKNSCRIVLSSDNSPPSVALEAYQQDTAIRIVSKEDGAVTVTSTIDDLDINDSHTYDWSQSDEGLTDIDSQDDSFTFNPSTLQPGLYRARLRVSDGSALHATELSLMVVDAHPSLSDVDSDGDGESDQDEGVGDRDGDGIPNYLDHNGLQKNILQQEQENATQYLIETEPGLSLALSDIAFFAQRNAAMITANDILDYTNSGLGGETDSDIYPYTGGRFGFGVNAIPELGSSVKLVIPQRHIIEADSIYRQLMPTGWQTFIEDSNNLIRSTQGKAGQCPTPGDTAFTDGLTEGDWCVEITIEDGGPNDADGEINGAIKALGGVTTTLPENTGSDGDDGGDGGGDSNGGDGDGGGDSNGGGGGAFSLWMLLMTILLLFISRSVTRKA